IFNYKNMEMDIVCIFLNTLDS
ncbi:hypothetical protein EAG_08663, partial [Camponotus floridanus]